MKIYIYILANRYDINDYFTTLLDMRYLILKNMYSIFVIIPQTLKNIYGLDTYKELYKSINEFNIYSKKMINTVERYGRLGKKIHYLEDNKLRTYDTTDIYELP